MVPIYLVYTGILALILAITVPKKEIQRLAIYGIIFGTITDIIIIVLIGIIGVGEYINYGPFGFMDIPFFPPIAWAAYFIMYLHFLPKIKPWNHIFTATAIFYSTLFSNVLVNLGIFRWYYGRTVVPFMIYLLWISTVTWTYHRLKQDNSHE